MDVFRTSVQEWFFTGPEAKVFFGYVAKISYNRKKNHLSLYNLLLKM